MKPDWRKVRDRALTAAPGLVKDLAVLASIAAIVVGVGQIYAPAGWIASGVINLAYLFLIERGKGAAATKPAA